MVSGLVSVLGLAACQGTAPTAGTAGIAGRMVGTAVFGTADAPAPTTLQPGLRYLQARLNTEPSAYLVLGELNPHPNGLALVWYSGLAQTVVTVDGRVVATRGLPLDWLAVRAPGAPTWAQVATAAVSLQYERERDVMPGYRLGVKERVTVQRLPGLHEGRVVVVERAVSSTGDSLESRFEFVPDQWREPVRSVQCLAATQCLTLQDITTQRPPATTAR